MSFAAEWLDLRAPADAAARDRALHAAAVAHLGRGAVALDLGCGTGAACGAFPAGARWRLVDADAGLLAIAARRCRGEVEPIRADLADLAGLPFEGVRLVTAFALLDLAGREWIEALAERVAAAGAGLYAPLCYDGALEWEPALPGDGALRAAFNAHQRRDKGLGEALGPGAAAAMARAMAARGYAVRLAPSPWRLGAGRGGAARGAGRRDRGGGGRDGPGGGGGLGSGAGGGEGLALHGRPSRRAGLAGGGERAIEDDVGVETVDVGLGPERVGEAGDRRGAEARGAGADDERRDGDVQPLQQAGVEEAGDGDAAALDEDAREPALGEGGADGGGGDPAVGGGELDDLDAARGAGAGRPE